MGSSCLISCSKCFYMKELKIGIGMMYSPELLMDLDSEFALLPDLISSKEILADIRMLLEEKDAEIADGYGHRVYRCPECNDFFDQFYLRLPVDGAKMQQHTGTGPVFGNSESAVVPQPLIRQKRSLHPRKRRLHRKGDQDFSVVAVRRVALPGVPDRIVPEAV
jgi:hypothetical protein